VGPSPTGDLRLWGAPYSAPFAPDRTPHWHIDYLRRHTRLEAVWYCCCARREHETAAAIGGLPGAVVALARFGSSDCGCETHLFWFEKLPPMPPVYMLVWNR
jgi:Uri superfamily endonuclease